MDRHLEMTMWSEISGVVQGETTPNLGKVCFQAASENCNRWKNEIIFFLHNKKWTELIWRVTCVMKTSNSVVLIDIRTYSTLSNLVSGLEWLPIGLGDFVWWKSDQYIEHTQFYISIIGFFLRFDALESISIHKLTISQGLVTRAQYYSKISL